MESNSGYPAEYHFKGEMVGQTKALSTNVLYYNGYRIIAEMEQELQRHGLLNNQKNESDWSSRAETLKNAIRSRLWQEDLGYYAYLEDSNEELVTQMEGLGESLLLLAPDLESNDTRIQQLFNNTHRTLHGIPCLWPPFEEKGYNPKDPATYYHNGRIWPFVQGYWAIAAARHGQVTVFGEELDRLARLAHILPNSSSSSSSSSNSIPTFAEFYEVNGTHLWERRRQLWSSAGFLGMILQGLFGIQMEPEGLRFRPIKPPQLVDQVITLTNLTYREAVLTIQVYGHGAVIKYFQINGEPKTESILPANAQGLQTIEISLKNE